MKKNIGIIMLALCCMIFGVSGAFCYNDKTDWPAHLRILAGPEGGQWFSLSEAMSQVLSKEILPSNYRRGGGISNIENISSKKGELGFSLTSFVAGAASGAPEYADIKTESISIIGNVYPQVLYFLIRTKFANKYDIKSVKDLLETHVPVRFALLKRGTASELFVRILFKYGYKIDYGLLRGKGWKIFFNNYPETVDDFASDNLDCFAYTAGTHVPLLLDMENYTKFTALPISDNVLDSLKEKFKFSEYVISPDLYRGIVKPIKTLSDFTCMIARKDLPDDLVYEILEALWNNKKDIAEHLVEFNHYSFETAIPKGVDLHPGAYKFWSRFLE